MTEKISKTIIKASIFTLIASIVLIMGVMYEHFTRVQFSQQRNELLFVEQGVEIDGKEYFDNIQLGTSRITWISEDGTVLYDSHADESQMENHAGREEFVEAMEKGFGESQRNSKTLSEVMLYSAIKMEDNSILRISTSQLSVMSLVLAILQPIVIILVLCIILSVILAHRISEKTVEPINNINLQNPLENEVYEELSPLLIKIDKQNKKIAQQIEFLNKKNEEITYVTENVSDAIIVLSQKGIILSANKKAKELLSCNVDSFYLDSFRNLDYQEIVERALVGKNSATTIKIDGRSYRFSASTVNLANDDTSVFLFISDITDEEINLEMRRQFTANVSHELKTPLSSIMGTAEIMSNGIVKSEDVPHFAGKIYEESSRLLKLIQDIIKISRLDEGIVAYEFAPVVLSNICNQVRSELIAKAEKNNVTIDVFCDNSVIKGYEPVIYEIAYNLCDNAISYNKRGGKVEIYVTGSAENVELSVSDTGIGISKSELLRVFERFYRVDKSHSKESGGTGLGLSIVKHGAILHKAEIIIDSQIDNGTTITIKFPI